MFWIPMGLKLATSPHSNCPHSLIIY